MSKKEDPFLQGICVALQCVKNESATAWAEIVRTVGVHEVSRYAAVDEPCEWELAGFKQHLRSEFGLGKPRKSWSDVGRRPMQRKGNDDVTTLG